jgi:hypothetical protein
LIRRAKEAAKDARKSASQAFQQQPLEQGGSAGPEGVGSTGVGGGRSGDEEPASTSGRGNDKEDAGGSATEGTGKAGPRRSVIGRLKVAFEAVRKEVRKDCQRFLS